MKKIALLFVAIATIVSLVACNEESTSSGVTTSKNDTSISTQTSSSVSEASSNEGTSSEITFNGLTVVDDADNTIKITRILPPIGLTGYVLEVFIENKSGERPRLYSVNSTHINGVQCGNLFSASLSKGETTTERLSFFTSELEEYGITNFTDIEIAFDVSEPLADPIYENDIIAHVYPYGEENATQFDREPQESDVVIVDNEDFTIIVMDYEEGLLGYTANLFIVNKMDNEIALFTDKESANGMQVDAISMSFVSPHKSAFGNISWASSDLKEAGITDVESLGFMLKVYDYDNKGNPPLFAKEVVLNP